MKECIVLAGGLGTRLRSAVSDLPKCMAPVAGKPFLHYLFKYLERQCVERVILSTGYLHEAVDVWVGATRWNFEILAVVEPEPLGTGGAIRLAMGQAGADRVLVVNGDTFFDVDVERLSAEHNRSGAVLSVALKPMLGFDRYGTVLTDADGRIASFREKQFCESGRINGGVYLLNRENHLFDGLPRRFSFETEVLQKRCDDFRFQGMECDGYFIDIGIPSDYRKANEELEKAFPC